jgi:hypothetical protein
MSRESESEQPQRTVAELLAEYGNSGEGAPRRRRRRAEDDEEVSGPQAIIDRVLSDSGTMQAIREDPRTGEPIPPASARSHRRLRPVQGTPAQQPPERQAPPPQPQQRAPQPPPQQQPTGAHAPTAYAQPVPPPQAPQQAPQQPNNPPTGRQQLPPSRPAMPPAAPPGAQPPVSRAPAAPPPSRPAMPPVGGAPTRGPMPPVGNAQTSRPAMPPVSPPGRVSPPLAARPPVDDYPDDDFTEQGYGSPAQAPPLPPPPLPAQPPQAGNPLQSRLGGPQRPEAAMTEELPPVLDEPPARPAQQPPTFRARPVGRRAPDGEPQATPGPLESTQAHAGPYLDDDQDEQFEAEFPQEHDDYAEQSGYPGERTQYARPPQPPPPPGPRNQGTQLINPNQLAGDDGYPEEEFDQHGYPAANDFPQDDVDLDPFEEQSYDRDFRGGGRDLRHEDGPDGSDDLDDVPPASTGREWLVTGAQVGVGAIAGAAVWLGFSWLWGLMPIAAIVAAVVVVIGLVLVVRKWRKAEDLQTTVLAILAGLVVTVSPAALLLVRR